MPDNQVEVSQQNQDTVVSIMAASIGAVLGAATGVGIASAVGFSVKEISETAVDMFGLESWSRFGMAMLEVFAVVVGYGHFFLHSPNFRLRTPMAIPLAGAFFGAIGGIAAASKLGFFSHPRQEAQRQEQNRDAVSVAEKVKLS